MRVKHEAKGEGRGACPTSAAEKRIMPSREVVRQVTFLEWPFIESIEITVFELNIHRCIVPS